MEKDRSYNRALMALGLISITWGTTWLPSKLLVGDYGVPPMQISSLRTLIAGSVFVLIFYFKTRQIPSWKQLGRIMFLSLFFIVLANAFSLMSLQYKAIGSGIGAVLGATVPLWVALLSIIFFHRQKFTLMIIAGLVLGFGGVLLIFSDELASITNPEILMPLVLSALASISWSLGTLLNAKSENVMHPFYSLGWQMLTGSLMLFIASLFFEDRVNWHQIPAAGWWSFAYLVLIGSFLSFASYMYALKHLPTTQVSTYAYINPIVALMLGIWWRKEPFTWSIVAGTSVTLLGVYLVNRGFEKQKKQP